MRTMTFTLAVALTLVIAGLAQADRPGVTREIEVLVEPKTAPPPPAPMAKPTTGTITMERWVVAAGIGASWGSGTVNYDGKSYRVRMSGLSFIDAGVARILDEGEITNIHDIRDIEGRYSSVDPGLTVIGGAGGSKLLNDNGVEIGNWNAELGLRIGIGPGPIWLSLE